MVTTTIATTASPVVSTTRAALLILEHAERVDLPLPFNVQTTDHRDRVDLLFSSLAAVTEWSKWIDSPIGETTTAHGNVHHDCIGRALDHPIRCTYIAFPTLTEATA